MSADRIAALEERVAALESRLATEPDDVAPDSPLWALEGLQAREEDPGAVLLVGHVELPDGRRAQWQLGAVTDDLLGADWTEGADVLVALGHPVRLRLLQRVLGGAMTVAELVDTDGVGTSGQVYHHLRQLTAAGWLRALGGGRYEVPVARVVPLLAVVLAGRR
ncbi:Helix-turn-helix domain-containing protein [Georgenia satyanarayanai]|uniref:Helix-turn-helix domain-containing protein n=1 Tax=Georgenia satyanarayanai TaxID=860221 RepID=A0A2Y9A6S6_9MICO|nr:helix-turn-helix domain-containing protein [Georgenia satyanarayanai]PYG00119.1 helix-turn-helix protein [Georgenia satyanarayanai]SSA40154.1 Helix-turn-helix domain-containing protein [Georgenia satyanarayanai]